MIRQSLIDYWSNKVAGFETEMESIVSGHNKQFNPKGIKRGAADGGEPDHSEPASKRLRLDEGVKKLSEHESQIADRRG